MGERKKRGKKIDSAESGHATTGASADQILYLMRSQGDNGWRENLKDRHSTADHHRNEHVSTGDMRSESWMVAYSEQMKKRVHACRAPKCRERFETEVELYGHQQAIHSAWPKSSMEPDRRVYEDAVGLRAAQTLIEHEFAFIVRDDVEAKVSDANRRELSTQRLNEMQDEYASRDLPTAATMCAGAVLYASLLRSELAGNDIGKMSGQFRGAIASLQHARGLGGELENAYRSLLFRSALMDEAELQRMADSEPEDQFCLAARSVLGRDPGHAFVPFPSGAVGELMQSMLKVAILRNASPVGPDTTGASLLHSRALVPWVKCLLDRLHSERSQND